MPLDGLQNKLAPVKRLSIASWLQGEQQWRGRNHATVAGICPAIPYYCNIFISVGKMYRIKLLLGPCIHSKSDKLRFHCIQRTNLEKQVQFRPWQNPPSLLSRAPFNSLTLSCTYGFEFLGKIISSFVLPSFILSLPPTLLLIEYRNVDVVQQYVCPHLPTRWFT